PPDPEGYFSVAFASDSQSMAAGQPHAIKILATSTGAEQASIPINIPNRRQGLAFAEDSRTLAIAAGGSTVKRWDSMVKKEIPAVRSSTHFSGVCKLAFAYGPALVAVTPEGQIMIWPQFPGDKNVVFTLPGGIRAAAVASDGRHLITANANGTIYI